MSRRRLTDDGASAEGAALRQHTSVVRRSRARRARRSVSTADRRSPVAGPRRPASVTLRSSPSTLSTGTAFAEVHEQESADAAAKLIERTCDERHVDTDRLHLHSDNGGPMKGATMLATLQRLGVVASFSRPRVSDDNPYSEALIRTLKYRPGFPNRPFRDINEARDWVSGFVRWYNTQHLHSALNFVTPDDRYHGRDKAILAARHRLYQRAKRQQPHRWSGDTRDWSPAPAAVLNPHQVITTTAAA